MTAGTERKMEQSVRRCNILRLKASARRDVVNTRMPHLDSRLWDWSRYRQCSPDPGEAASNAARMPSIVPIRHVPYLDHNYGQPPPMTPPDSSSPAPDDGDTGNEDEEGDGITRCICGFHHDDGYMICCDKCSVWQHIECMGISSAAVPENYLCEQCDPRPLDKDRAKAIQTRKIEEMSDDDNDDDDDDSEEDRESTTYTAVSTTPTRITLTAKVSHQKRKRTLGKNKRPKQRLPPDLVPVDEETNMAWENSSHSDLYEKAVENIYSKELEELAGSLNDNFHDSVMVPEGNLQYVEVVEVQKNTKGIVTAEDLDKNQFLIKCKGRMMLGSSFDAENPFFKRYSPYILYYRKLDHLELCVDARTFGNDARFVRRSCSPNAEVRHYISKGKFCLALFSLFPLPKGSEVTIPFEHSYNEYKSHLTCACSQDTCAVIKFNLRCQQQNHSPEKVKESPLPHLTHPDDSSNSGHHNSKLSPLRMSLPGHNSFHGDSDSDIENNPDRSILTESESRRKKLSREERKLEAYVKQIEKMEKKEKKRQQPSKELKQISKTPTDEGKVLQRSMRGSGSGIKRLNHKRKANTASSAMKKKRTRVSSCSSEPLSPDEVSSSASTPTTPKMVATIPEEPQTETPGMSPNRNFRFPKMKQLDEDSQEHPLKLIIKTEAVESNATSCPSSPCSPRESETETKPTLSTASSNSDIAMEVEMDEVEGVNAEEMCDSSVDEQGFSSLAGQLAELSSVASNESNTPSPCPSTSASPTCSESVMNGFPPLVGARSPGPAPGSPLAAVLHGPRATRSNPLYCSLKKRWLCQFLYGYNLPDTKPPNGLKHHVRATSAPIPSITPLHSRKTYARLQHEPLPLKKRHLKSFQDSTTENDMQCSPVSTITSYSTSTTPSLNHHSPYENNIDIQNSDQHHTVLCTTTGVTTASYHTSYANVTSEEDARFERHCVVTEPSDKGQPSLHLSSGGGVVCTSSYLLLGTYPKYSDTRTIGPLHVDTTLSVSKPPSSMEQQLPENVSPRVPPEIRPVPEYQPLTIKANPVRRVSDPRLVSPGGAYCSTTNAVMTSVITSTAGLGSPSVILASPVQQPLTVITSPLPPTTVISSTDMHCSTPGKKKVSLLEYRNRSRQRLSGDSPKTTTAPSFSSSTTPLTSPTQPVTTPAMMSVSSGSLPNLVFPVRTPASLRRMSTGTVGNGPCFEPVSPDDDDRQVSGVTKLSNSLPPSQDNSKIGSPSAVDPVTRKKLLQKSKEIFTRKQEGITRLNQHLSAIISEQLMKDTTKGSPGSNHSPSRGSNSPGLPPPPPPPPAEQAGDAMEIEDEDSQPSSKIFVNTPVVSAHSAPTHSPVITEYVRHQPQVADYRPSLQPHHAPTQPPSLLVPLVSVPHELQAQISSQSQARLSQGAPYLVTSQAVPAHVAYPTSYQAQAPAQGATTYYQQ